VEREHALQRRSFERTQRAAVDRTAALQRLVADPGADLDEAAGVWLAASPWLDRTGGDRIRRRC
jgi:hypothetical protein